jgi:hypothetical protein
VRRCEGCSKEFAPGVLDAIRDILERSIDELPDELPAVFVACVVDGITPGAVCRVVCTHTIPRAYRMHVKTEFLISPASSDPEVPTGSAEHAAASTFD